MVTMGLFAPLPLALMIPFMAGQSFAMGEAFGKGFQYGKRRISAQTNEEFNKMSAKDHFNETTADIKSMIPEMKSAMSSFAFLQQDIIKELLSYIKDTAGTIVETVQTGGTEVAQSTLDGLRTLVGLPPLYSKLVSPAGINALFSWWKSIRFSPNTTDDIRIRLKLDFSGTPTSQILDIIKAEHAKIIGPTVPPGGIIPPTESPFDEDTRGTLEESSLFQGDAMRKLISLGYNLHPTPKFIAGATSKRRRTQSTDLELDKILKQLFSITQFAVDITRIKSDSEIKTFIDRNLQPITQRYFDFQFTYSYI